MLDPRGSGNRGTVVVLYRSGKNPPPFPFYSGHLIPKDFFAGGCRLGEQATSLEYNDLPYSANFAACRQTILFSGGIDSSR